MSTIGHTRVRCWWYNDEQDTLWLIQEKYWGCQQSQQNSSAAEVVGTKCYVSTQRRQCPILSGESHHRVGVMENNIMGDKTRKSQIKIPSPPRISHFLWATALTSKTSTTTLTSQQLPCLGLQLQSVYALQALTLIYLRTSISSQEPPPNITLTSQDCFFLQSHPQFSVSV